MTEEAAGSIEDMAIAERIPCVLAIAAVSTGPKASPKLPDRVN
ncbi:MAG: hypothetical protein NTX81_10325 [Candidatus Bathyarchaeota archaeon]|nr:hypothetical protein [Candidatus Bathyarchaeota archaeon]